MKCAAYIRTASKNQTKVNLEKQTEMITTFISEKSWQLDSIYSDVGSGVQSHKSLQAMIKDAKEGKFDIIVVTSLSRIARTNELVVDLIDLCKQGKVNLVTTDNLINTLHDDISKLTLFSELYIYESKKISQRIKQGKITSKKAAVN
jgi:DNA invertase Pin-like site-specific DNA recombinase